MKIKFRGFSRERNGWVYGYYYKGYSGANYIIGIGKDGRTLDIDIPVAEGSINPFTGLTDMQGKEIYEGDILLLETNKGKQKHSVEWVNHQTYCGFKIYGVDRRWNVKLTNSRIVNGKAMIIGSLYQDPRSMLKQLK